MNERSRSAGSYDAVERVRVVDRRRLEHGFEAGPRQGAQLGVTEDVLGAEGVPELLLLLLKCPFPVLRVSVECRSRRGVAQLAAVVVVVVAVVVVWQRQC